MLDPSEEYVIVPMAVLERMLRYAYVVCEEHCAEKRDATTCYYIYKLAKGLRLPPPPCARDYGEFRREDFEAIVRGVAKKHKMSARTFVESRERRGVRSLEEHIDLIEVRFALNMLEVFEREGRRKDILLVRGSDIEVKSALRTL